MAKATGLRRKLAAVEARIKEVNAEGYSEENHTRGLALVNEATSLRYRIRRYEDRAAHNQSAKEWRRYLEGYAARAERGAVSTGAAVLQRLTEGV
ncbi:MAG: hypothetical protein OXQ90_09630 [Gammaproteobacteria bacterium]|nr:hypothetical protein [Gammaproteobacteria bacterium]